MIKNSNETSGIFDSWEIINKEVAIKKCDKSFFVHNGSGIPIETRWFFDTNELQAGARKEFVLIFRKSEYKAYITRETASSKRTRIFWHTDLSKIFNNLFERCDTYPSMRFKKVADEKYEISFIDIDLVENENNDNLESRVPSAHNSEGRKVAYYVT